MKNSYAKYSAQNQIESKAMIYKSLLKTTHDTDVSNSLSYKLKTDSSYYPKVSVVNMYSFVHWTNLQ